MRNINKKQMGEDFNSKGANFNSKGVIIFDKVSMKKKRSGSELMKWNFSD